LNNLEIDNIQPKISILWAVLGLRIGLFAIELGTAIWSHSLSLLAGTGHLFSDLLTMVLTFGSAWVMQRHSPRQNPQAERQINAWIGLVNAISLGAISMLIALEAVEHFHNPEPISSIAVLLVAVLSLCGNSLVVYLLDRQHHALDTERDLNLRGVFLHGVADAASALSAIVAGGAMYFFGWLWADAAAGLLVAMLIGLSAVSLMRSAFSVLRQDSH
jgi:cobalt-zinc-cadmium efflux system protein